MRKDVAELLVRAVVIAGEDESRQVLAAERRPAGTWYAIAYDEGQLWLESLHTIYGPLIAWVRKPIRLTDDMNATSALAAQTWAEIGEEEFRQLDIKQHRDLKRYTILRSQYKRAAHQRIGASVVAASVDLLAQCKKLGIGGRANFDGVSVGKRMGKDTYVHRDYQTVFPGVEAAAARLPAEFDYAVVKCTADSGCFSFIECGDFDTAPEPTVGTAARVCGEKVTWRKAGDDPMIYHHKWAMVGDDYEGFDAAASMRRSVEWKSIVGKDAALSSRIGKKSVWESEVLPKLASVTAKETPNQYRQRTDKCPPGHRGNETPRCIDMKENRKKSAWLKQQKLKDQREKEKKQRARKKARPGK